MESYCKKLVKIKKKSAQYPLNYFLIHFVMITKAHSQVFLRFKLFSIFKYPAFEDILRRVLYWSQE